MNYLKEHIDTLNKEKLDCQNKLAETKGLTAKAIAQLKNDWLLADDSLQFVAALDAKMNPPLIVKPPDNGMKIMN